MSEAKQIILFNVKDQCYGFDMEDVYEVDTLKENLICKFPNSPEYIEGIMNLSGEVVPIVNLNKKFELSEKKNNKKSSIIIVKVDRKIVGFLLEGTTTKEFDAETIEKQVQGDFKCIKSIINKDSENIYVLDVKNFLELIELGDCIV